MFDYQIIEFSKAFNPDANGEIFEPFPAFRILKFKNYRLEWILIPTGSAIPNSEFAFSYAKTQFQLGIRVIWIHQYFWENYPQLTQSRLLSLFKNRTRIHARQCKLTPVSKEQGRHFLQQNHALGFSRASHFWGLIHLNQLVAVASFSGPRKMIHENPVFDSWEWERFASLEGTTVVGGMHKLLNHHLKTEKVQHLMSYADLAWGFGNAYSQLGFKLEGFRPAPLLAQVGNQLKLHTENSAETPIWLPGSLKFILDLRQHERI